MFSSPVLGGGPVHHCYQMLSLSPYSEVQSSWQLSQASTQLAGLLVPGQYLLVLS